jgi:hypothetical protein
VRNLRPDSSLIVFFSASCSLIVLFSSCSFHHALFIMLFSSCSFHHALSETCSCQVTGLASDRPQGSIPLRNCLKSLRNRQDECNHEHLVDRRKVEIFRASIGLICENSSPPPSAIPRLLSQEIAHFVDVAEANGCGDKWGLFSSHIPHRVSDSLECSLKVP